MICDYYLTYSCDCSCDFCPVWRDETLRNVPLSPARSIEKNIAALKRLGTRRINFTGGEPLVRDDLPDILSSARRHGMYISLYTSGIRFPKKAGQLRGLADRLYVSVDAPTEEMHNEIRGQESFAEALDALAVAGNYGMKPVMNFTATRDSVRFLPEMVELAEKTGALLNINPVHHYQGLEGFERITVDYISRYSSNRNVILDRRAMSLIKSGGNRTSSPACRVVDNWISISPDDRLILPCFFGAQSTVPIDGKLEELYRSDIMRGYRKLQGRLKPCEGCVDPRLIDASLYGRTLSAAGSAFKFVRERIKKWK